jgi:apolipoprotein N-acyltransferase
MNDRNRIGLAAAAALLAVCLHGAAAAQQVYRCGNQYSQQPCPGGKEVEVADPRSNSEAKRADAETARQAKAADAMEKTRLQQEAKAPAAVILPERAPAAKAKPAQTAEGKEKDTGKEKGKAQGNKPKKPDYFTAVSPKKPGDAPVKKKARDKQSG